MKGVGRIAAAAGAAVAGIGAAIFLLPRHGGRRRRSAAGVARRQTAHVSALVGARASRREAELVEVVRAELARRFGDESAEVGVTAHKGTVTLRGEVSRLDAIDAFEDAARSIGGVNDVNNLLRLFGKARAAL
ncbi:MAG TPA: BON domain-containing protein [Candidatus Dormibacteraeota bacterium]|jgi:osmotically-inducible protein OsmY